MGLDVSELTAEQAKKIGVPEDTKGLLVRRVRPGGLAVQLGIRPNDVITEIQGQPVQTVEQFNDILGKLSPSEGISITAINKSGTKSLSFRIGR